MSVFLAAYALKWEPVQTDLLNEMCAVLTSAGTVNTYLHGSIAVAYVDMNLWPGKSTRVFAEGLSVFAGDPLLCDNDITYSRPDGIDILTSEISISGVSALRLAEGTFAGLVVDRHGNRLHAFTDKLGVRPIYWCQTGSHIFVSSTLWALQAMPGLRQSPNWNAAAETAAFGFPLGNRTLIEPFRVLGSGHALCVVENEVSDQCYWDWTKLPKNSLAGNALLEHIEEAFHSAVDRRCIGQTKVMAFLSGGMDSRLIVSRLRAHRIRVHSLNFAPDGSQDLVFGRMVAERLGCNHFEYAEGDLGFADRQAVALTKWKLVNPDTNEHPERPGLVWSGDGGSVGLGFVYLSSSVIAIARTKGLLAAAQALQRDNKNYMPSAMLRAKSKSLAKLPLQGILDDLESRPTTELGQAAQCDCKVRLKLPRS